MMSVCNLKVQYAALGEKQFNQKRKSLNKPHKLFVFMTKQTDLKGQHNITLFYFVYMWRTLPPFQLQTVFWDLIFL